MHVCIRPCPNCGRLFPVSYTCGCTKTRRMKKRKAAVRNKIPDNFYGSSEWRKLRKQILDRFDEMDVYQFATDDSDIFDADVVHHIVPLQDDASLAFSEENLIPLSHKTHRMVHNEYKKSEAAKIRMQNILRNCLAEYFMVCEEDSVYRDMYPMAETEYTSRPLFDYTRSMDQAGVVEY